MVTMERERDSKLTTSLNVRMSEADLAKLSDLARATDRTTGSVLRRLIRTAQPHGTEFALRPGHAAGEACP